MADKSDKLARYANRLSLPELIRLTGGANVGHSCPKCNCRGPHTVLETRQNAVGVRRRLECRHCLFHFTSIEVVVSSAPETPIAAKEE